MNSVLVGQLVIVMCLQAIIASLLYAGYRVQKDNALKEWEFRSELAQARREGHLQIMKAIKGKSYVGQFGEIDVHEDPDIPPGTPVMANPTPPAEITCADD